MWLSECCCLLVFSFSSSFSSSLLFAPGPPSCLLSSVFSAFLYSALLFASLLSPPLFLSCSSLRFFSLRFSCLRLLLFLFAFALLRGFLFVFFVCGAFRLSWFTWRNGASERGACSTHTAADAFLTRKPRFSQPCFPWTCWCCFRLPWGHSWLGFTKRLGEKMDPQLGRPPLRRV